MKAGLFDRVKSEINANLSFYIIDTSIIAAYALCFFYVLHSVDWDSFNILTGVGLILVIGVMYFTYPLVCYFSMPLIYFIDWVMKLLSKGYKKFKG